MSKIIINTNTLSDRTVELASVSTLVDGYLRPILAQHIDGGDKLEATLQYIEQVITDIGEEE